MDYRACTLILLIGMMAMATGAAEAYNASVEPNITSSAGDVANELYKSLDNSPYPAILSSWIPMGLIFLTILLFAVAGYAVLRALGVLQ